MRRRRLVAVAVLVGGILAVAGGFGAYRVFLAPNQEVVVYLDAGVDPQAVARQVAGSDGVANPVAWCGGAGPGPDIERRLARTFAIIINRGQEAQALRRAQEIPGVRQAELDPIPGPCPNNLA